MSTGSGGHPLRFASLTASRRPRRVWWAPSASSASAAWLPTLTESGIRSGGSSKDGTAHESGRTASSTGSTRTSASSTSIGSTIEATSTVRSERVHRALTGVRLRAERLGLHSRSRMMTGMCATTAIASRKAAMLLTAELARRRQPPASSAGTRSNSASHSTGHRMMTPVGEANRLTGRAQAQCPAKTVCVPLVVIEGRRPGGPVRRHGSPLPTSPRHRGTDGSPPWS